MHTRNILLACTAVFLLAVVAPLAISQEKSDTKLTIVAPPGVDPKVMEEMMKLAAPGPEHALLKKLEGRYSADVTCRMAPDQPEMKSKGEESAEMIMGGRWLKGDYSGEMMGQPFKGIYMSGYDNTKKKFVSTWIDDMSTSMMVSEGTADSTGKVITYTGECPCPMEGGKLKPFRTVMTINDDGTHQFEMFAPGPDGKEFKNMTIKYTPVK